MKFMRGLMLVFLAVFSLGVAADVTVETYHGDDQTFSDPQLKENVEQDAQDAKDDVREDESEGNGRADDTYSGGNMGRR
jgi:hypothetical protein